MLDPEDKKTIDRQSLDLILQALEEVVFPKFEEMNQKFEQVNQNFKEVKKRFDSVDTRLDTIDQDVTGVKYRLGEVEKKVETLIDSSIQVKFLEKRVTKLEASVA